MNSEILFISDLHLTLGQPKTTQLFLDFIKQRAKGVAALYILGDFFDTWIGDDDPLPPNNSIKRYLKTLTVSGTEVYLQQGNRDFLLGERFCLETGVILLGDYALINLFNQPTLLMHGDLLCTDDTAYLEFRAKSRTNSWRQSMLSKPLFLRLLISRWYCLRSYFHKHNKTLAIKDVNQQSVLKAMRQYKVLRLIHGHTHRPAVHDFTIDGKQAQRFVLPDWKHSKPGVLCWNQDGYSIENLTH